MLECVHKLGLHGSGSSKSNYSVWERSKSKHTDSAKTENPNLLQKAWCLSLSCIMATISVNFGKSDGGFNNPGATTCVQICIQIYKTGDFLKANTQWISLIFLNHCTTPTHKQHICISGGQDDCSNQVFACVQ